MNKGKTSISMRGRWMAILILLAAYTKAEAQLVWQETFNTSANCTSFDSLSNYTSVNGAWTIRYPIATLNDSVGSFWFVSNRESFTGLNNCGDGCQTNAGLTNNTLHISTNATGTQDQGAIYNDNIASNIIAWSPAISTVGLNQMLLEFDYFEGGDTADNASLVIAVGNTNVPITILDLPKTFGPCGVSGQWNHVEVYLDSTYNNLFNFYIGYRWTSNGDGNGSNPSFAVDNITITDTIATPAFSMAQDTICSGNSVDFINQTIGSNNTYTWTFQGGVPNTSTAKNPQNITYPTPGLYYITLTATNNTGSFSSFVDSIQVETCIPPTPNFSASTTNICVGQCIDFEDASIPGTFGTGQWQWLFQGATPNTSTLENPTNVCYTAPGTYDITLTVADTVTGLFQDSVFVDAITVGNCFVPTVAFTSDTNRTCNNDFIEFYALHSGDPDTITWIFEGGNPASITQSLDSVDTISVFYPIPGTYDVIIIASNPAGTASDTIRNYVTIDTCPIPTARINANRTTICPNTEVQFIDNSIAPRTWYWEFPGGQPSSSTNQTPPPITYTTPGTYPVVLIVTNVNGADTLIAEEYITVDSCNVPVPRFETERDSICRSTCLQLFNTSKYLDIRDTTDSFAWILWYHPYPELQTGTAADTISPTTPGYEWMADDSNLIAFNDTFFVIWKDYFPAMAPIWNQNDPILCFDDSGTIGIQMFAYNQYGVGVRNDQDLPIINIGGRYPDITPGPDITLRIDNPESRFFLEDTTSFRTTGTGPYWKWFPEEGLSCYDCPRPIIYPLETRKYYVTNFDDYGCQAYDSVTVYVEEGYYAGIPNIFSPNGDNLNDILYVVGNGISSEGFTMRIWDRFGEVVFESFSQNDGWDGKVKGVAGPSGTYKYYVKFVFEDGNVQELSGNVTLVRY